MVKRDISTAKMRSGRMADMKRNKTNGKMFILFQSDLIPAVVDCRILTWNACMKIVERYVSRNSYHISLYR